MILRMKWKFAVFIFVKIFFNPYNYAENKSLLEFSAQHGIVTEAYSSLA